MDTKNPFKYLNPKKSETFKSMMDQRQRSLGVVNYIKKHEKINSNKENFKIRNPLLSIMLLFIIQKGVFLLEQYSIEIKVNRIGNIQILSDEYTGLLPNKSSIKQKRFIYMDEHSRNVLIQSLDELIVLEWENKLSNFSHMFSNLFDITSININKNIFGDNSNLEYMFYNCYNLENISFSSTTNDYSIANMNKMFYNCLSLTSINLQNLNIVQHIDLSYMFYNCQKLVSYVHGEIKAKDIKYMFYNCNSLKQVNLRDFKTSSYQLNMSRFFYNCNELSEIVGNFAGFNFTDAREMFYNCNTLTTVNFAPSFANLYVNMSKMFYNCYSLENMAFGEKDSQDYYANDLSKTFYNCTSLKNLNFYHLKTDHVEDISYMMYNCKNLIQIDFHNTSFYNNLTKNMKGTFQNCESLTSFSFPNFYTGNTEIMTDMFKGCGKMEKISLESFDTSNVKDMESMFEGCSSLTDLSLKSFKTPKVHYMNKMFRDCINLKTLNFTNITSESLGTMHQMFYNCSSLKYLNLYSLTEKDQTTKEMFEGVTNNFTICVKEQDNITNIFQLLNEMENVERDCSSSCYGEHNQRPKIPGTKTCCPHYLYNDTCYDKCPSKTKSSNEDKICSFFDCPKFYNYYQNSCLVEIPEGYYCNDTISKTIDKCLSTCKTCKFGNNCTTCGGTYKYFYFGKCLENCSQGYSNISGIDTCNCQIKGCEECTDNEEGLCTKCAKDYYAKEDDDNQGDMKRCYKDPPFYYLNKSNNIYERCYHSCQFCYGRGDKKNHNCKNCTSNSTFSIKQTIDGDEIEIFNCYEFCDYYYYFVDNDYFCTNTSKCPFDYPYLIENKSECVKLCNTEEYSKLFRKRCINTCPPEDSKENEEDSSKCDLICTEDKPFEIYEEQICVANCSIMDLKNKVCGVNPMINKTTSEINDIIQDNILKDLTYSFNFSIITDTESLILEEYGVLYEIISTKNKNPVSNLSSISIKECEYILKDYYKIGINESLYMLKIDVSINGKTGPSNIYGVYYPLIYPYKLESLDLTICEGSKINVVFPIELENPELYDIKHPYYNDICYSYSSDRGFDVTLNDRKQEYSDNNMSLCEENCEFASYNETKKQVECLCEIKIDLPLISEMSIDKNKLYQFMDIKNVANLDILKCYNVVLSKDGLIKNIGFYFCIPSMIMYLVCLISFMVKDYRILKVFVHNFVIAKENLNYYELRKKRERERPKKRKYELPIILQIFEAKNIEISNALENEGISHRNRNIGNLIKENTTNVSLKSKANKEIILEKEDIKNQNKNNEAKEKIKNFLIINQIKKRLNINTKKEPSSPIDIIPKKKRNQQLTENNSTFNDNATNDLDDLDFNEVRPMEVKKDGKLTKKDIDRINLIFKYNDYELNDLSYNKALKSDHRTYPQYYFSRLKTNHMIFQILNTNDYNSRIIKIYLCFCNFALTYSVNALFFNDNTMHKIYLDGGDYNFIYQLPQILYSTGVSTVIQQLLNFLALSENAILEVKKEKILKNLKLKRQSVLRILFCKFLLFFNFSFFFMMISFYYLICFCAVYKNTQFHLIKDTLISYSTSLLTPLGLNLIPGIFRIRALRKKKPMMYKFSKILQLFF